MIELRRRFVLNTPLGPALCWGVTTRDTVEVAMLFHVWQTETNEPWNWANPDVRIAGSNSARRHDAGTPIYLSEERIAFLLPHILRHTQSPFYWKVTQ